jgi:hypothetical protein
MNKLRRNDQPPTRMADFDSFLRPTSLPLIDDCDASRSFERDLPTIARRRPRIPGSHT